MSEKNIVIKHRCVCCHKVLRDDGTCQNPDCVRYVAEDEEQEADADDNA